MPRNAKPSASPLAQDLHHHLTASLMSGGSFSPIGSQYRVLSKMDLIRGADVTTLDEPLCEGALRTKGSPALQAVVAQVLEQSSGQTDEIASAYRALTHLVRSEPSEMFLRSLLTALELSKTEGWSAVPLVESGSVLAVHRVSNFRATPELIREFSVAYRWLETHLENFSEVERFSLIPLLVESVNKGLKPEALLPFAVMLGHFPGDASDAYPVFNLIQSVFKPEDQKLLRDIALTARPDPRTLREFVNQYRSALYEVMDPPDNMPRPLGSVGVTVSRFRSAVAVATSRGNLDPGNIVRLVTEAKHGGTSATKLAFVATLLSLTSSTHKLFNVDELTPSMGSVFFSRERMQRFIAQSSEGASEPVESAFRRLNYLLLEQVIVTYAPRREMRPSEHELALLHKAIDIALSQKKQIVLDEYLDIFESLMDARALGKTDVLNAGIQGWEQYLNRGILAADYLKSYIDLKEKVLDEAAEKLFRKLYEYNIVHAPEKEKDLALLVTEIASAPESALIIQNLLKEGEAGASASHILNAARDAAIGGLAVNYQRVAAGPGRLDVDEQKASIMDRVAEIAGQFHFYQSFSRAERVMRLQSRIATISTGFLGLAADAEHSHAPGKVSMIERMAEAVGECRIIHSEDIRGNPGGPGVEVRNVSIDRILAPDMSVPGDRFHIYKTAWPEYADVLDSIDRTRLFLTRGSLILIAPTDQKLEFLYPVGGSRVNYGIVIFNSHHGTLTERAFLVDSRILSDRIAPCLYPRGQKTGRPVDINAAGITPRELMSIAESDPLAVLNLGSGNSVLGGFANSFNLKAGHLHLFRNLHLLGEIGRDNYGYPDLTHYLNPPPELRLRETFHQIDSVIAQVTERALSYVDIHLLILSQYKKGYVHAPPAHVEMNRPLDGKAGPGFDDSVSFLSSPDQRYANRATLRLLEEARAYREFSREAGHASDDYRVLAYCDTQNLSARPTGEVSLDTETGILSIDGIETELNLDSLTITPEDRMVWLEQVMPRLDPYFKTLRFFRKSHFSLHE